MSRDFKVYSPIGVWLDKSAPAGMQRRIGGVISTDSRDREDETVLQNGLDFRQFIDHGWFNDNHSKETPGAVGYPSKVQFVRKGDTLPDGTIAKANGHWAEGHLLEGHPPADDLWSLAQSLEKTQGRRRLGFSIEGRILRRAGPDRKTIAAAEVRNVAITNCFPGSVRVRGRADKVTRRWYSGRMVTIRLATGETLTGTPNHPVFTNLGWVALGDLDEGVHRIGRCGSNVDIGSVVPHDVDDVPPSLEELFDLSSVVRSGFGVRTIAQANFYGYGDLGQSDVDVVHVESELRHHLVASFTKKFGEDVLPTSDEELLRLPGLGPLALRSHLVSGASPSFVGGSGQRLALLGGAQGVSSKLLCGSGSSDPSAPGHVVYGDPGDSVFGRDAGRRLSGCVGFSDLVFKSITDFTGHVYDLDTDLGWYEASGIVVHNCPVNTDTYMVSLAKSLKAAEEESLEDLIRSILREELDEKALTSVSGAALRVESLDRRIHDQIGKSVGSTSTLAAAAQWVANHVPGITPMEIGRFLAITSLLKHGDLV